MDYLILFSGTKNSLTATPLNSDTDNTVSDSSNLETSKENKMQKRRKPDDENYKQKLRSINTQ